jgi:hypothetical protein
MAHGKRGINYFHDRPASLSRPARIRPPRAVHQRRRRGDDLKLFLMTYAAGFLMVSIFIA